MATAAVPASVNIPGAAGVSLAGLLFQPAGEPQAAIVLHGATGVPRDYYARFAAWAAEARQAAVLIYDYRDCGHSAQVPVKQARATMADWAVRDQAAALELLHQRFPDLPLEVIGHSLGGLGLPFHDRADRVVRMVAVASGPAHWSRHPPGFVPKALAFWYLAGPVLTTLLGYMPGWVLGQGAHLPASAYWEWRRWCVTPGFYRRDWGSRLPQPDLSRMKGRLRLVAIADDPMLPPPVVRDLAGFYPAAQVENHLIEPAAAGVASIGHLRVFSERCRAVWPVLAGL
ncbi:alpha/beta fold hydrolase [Niveispirillum sp. BGYR6]|uniref:alpha/beta hydrolase family protein n=1 Tax=Niveispirillum sp. BGYR6 TaxID=2971249 RepID=UPI0022B99AEB|nr:alpha/beta fold hydrolase [Niveispirillum sp. BGYR6]MDG5496693.1 alpha/beta hydrolase [Niveispirillum sp. BGYR6]